uniref:Uncharacterized protein n=1 Tax=Anguilla anguilla TaxID=7936 RepID=A0A0E9UPY3_ANGAN
MVMDCFSLVHPLPYDLDVVWSSRSIIRLPLNCTILNYTIWSYIIPS